MTHARRGPGAHHGKLWLDFDEVHWFGSELTRRGGALAAAVVPDPPAFVMTGTPAFAVAGSTLVIAPPAPRTFRGPDRSSERRRRLLTRLAPVAALTAACGAATLWAGAGMPGLRAGKAEPTAGVEAVAPAVTIAASVQPTSRTVELVPVAATTEALRSAASSVPDPEIAWRSSSAVGAPHAGRLVRGVQLPVEGPGWATWDPVRDRSPNRAARLWGTDGLVRTVLAVIEDYRAAHPDAPPLVIGDVSRQGGGAIDEHVSHQNGLDIDIYYPRRDGKLRPPSRVAQIDRALAQDLVDRFVAAGAQVLFVGQSTSVRGPRDVVVPYPNHNDHVHVRFARSRA